MGFPDHHLCRLSSLLPLAPGPGLHLDARAEDGPRKDEVPLPLPLPLSMPRPRMPGRADMAGQRSPESLTGEVALSLSHPRSTFSPSTHSARHSMVHVRPLPSLCRTASTRTESAVLFRQFRGPGTRILADKADPDPSTTSATLRPDLRLRLSGEAGRANGQGRAPLECSALSRGRHGMEIGAISVRPGGERNRSEKVSQGRPRSRDAWFVWCGIPSITLSPTLDYPHPVPRHGFRHHRTVL